MDLLLTSALKRGTLIDSGPLIRHISATIRYEISYCCLAYTILL